MGQEKAVKGYILWETAPEYEHILLWKAALKKSREKMKKTVDKLEKLWYINQALTRAKCLTRKGFRISA